MILCTCDKFYKQFDVANYNVTRISILFRCFMLVYLHNLEYRKIVHFTRAYFVKYVNMDVKRVSNKNIFGKFRRDV